MVPRDADRKRDALRRPAGGRGALETLISEAQSLRTRLLRRAQLGPSRRQTEQSGAVDSIIQLQNAILNYGMRPIEAGVQGPPACGLW
jgi:hypothetical protein